MEKNDIDQYLSEVEANLPSNFSWRVMQRILAIKIEQARGKARWEVSLISVGTLLGTLALVFSYSLYAGTPAWQVPLWGTMALPALGVLAVFFILDSALSERRSANRQSHGAG